MTDGGSDSYVPFADGATADPVDRAIMATMRAVFPLHGLEIPDADGSR